MSGKTLRAGPLSSPRIRERLGRDFVNSWVLIQRLEAMADSPDPHLAAAARTVFNAYLFPVDSMILSSEGELLDHVCANKLEDGDAPYERLLDAARR